MLLTSQDGTNVVYCAPTSGGKSIVAEVLLLRQLLAFMPGGEHYEKPKSKKELSRQPLPRALLILPFIRCVIRVVMCGAARAQQNTCLQLRCFLLLVASLCMQEQ